MKDCLTNLTGFHYIPNENRRILGVSEQHIFYLKDFYKLSKLGFANLTNFQQYVNEIEYRNEHKQSTFIV